MSKHVTPDKYDELNDTLLYSSPHLEEGPSHPGVDGRPAHRGDEPVTDPEGNELHASRRREWTARDDTRYTGGSSGDPGQYADVDAMDGQATGDRIDGDPGALVSESSGTAGSYWQGALVHARDEELPSLPAPFPIADERLAGCAPPGAYARERFPLATEERIAGEYAELERQREQAHAAASVGIARARRCRSEVTARQHDSRSAIHKRPVFTAETDGPDPREDLSQSELAAVNKEAARLSEDLPFSPPPADLSRAIAEKVVRGTTVPEATFAVRDSRLRPPSVQPIDSVGPWAYEVTIQGRVEVLFDPADVSQQQVGLVTDDSGTAKVTVWTKSGSKPLLQEGDLVRIRFGKPGRYNGQPTVAVVAETQVTILERGDGPARTFSHDWGDPDSGFAGEQRHGPCTLPPPGEGEVESRPTHVPEPRRSLPVEQPDAVTKDKVGPGSLTAGAWLQTDVVFPAVAVVPRFSSEAIDRRRRARASDDPTESGSASPHEPIGHTIVRIPFPDWWIEQESVTAVRSSPTDERGAASIDGEGPVDGELPDAAAPLSERPRFPPRTGGAFRLSRSFDSADVADHDEGGIGGAGQGLGGDASGDASATTPVANGGTSVMGPTTSVRCPDCDHDRAAYHLQQTRSADEAPTRLYTCTACHHRWREDD